MTMVCVFFSSLLLPAACSSGLNPTSKVKVVNGRTINVSDYPEVVLLGTEDGKPLCSGTFISRDAVLTAAHCTKKGQTVDPTTYQVKDLTLDLIQLDDPRSKTYSVVSTSVAVYRSPKWDEEFPVQMLNKYDMAIVKFPENTSAYTHDLAQNEPNPGDDFVIVGYGINYVPGRFDFAIDRSSAGIKRMGTNTIQELVDGMIRFTGPTKTTAEDGNNAGSSKGDSGGPMFVHDKLVGVTSGGRLTPAGEELRSTYYTDVNSSASRQFIRRVMEAR